MGFGPHGYDFTIARAIFRQGQGGLSPSPSLPVWPVQSARFVRDERTDRNELQGVSTALHFLLHSEEQIQDQENASPAWFDGI